MENTNNINSALASIQAVLNAPKNQYNSFGRYKYRSCEDILAAVKPLLKEAGCTLTLNDDIVLIGNRVYVKATATLANANGQTAQTTAFAREAETKSGMDVSQITGAASSYARKYALNGLFAIDDTKDADSLNTSPKYTQAAPNKQQPCSDRQTVPNKQQPNTDRQADTARLMADAIAKAEQVKSFDEYAAWWYAFPQLQTNDQFIALARKLASAYPQPKKAATATANA